MTTGSSCIARTAHRVPRAALALIAGLALTAAAGRAADFSDPDWPCIQPKVAGLSTGLMWPAPIPPATSDAPLSAEIAALAEVLSLRRVDEDAMRVAVAEFAAGNDAGMDVMGRVFEATFTTLSRRRSRILQGIADYSESQIALAARIDAARVEMDAGLDAPAPDYDRPDALEEQIDWDERIYTDRQKSLTYVCETPVLLEKRLYSIAQILQRAVRD